ncbi:MAG: hypothetical protein M5U14_15660 [Acidimicrobiia bacterium]|nr:hypothetical protein [Acidimicrobiia bacterium]
MCSSPETRAVWIASLRSAMFVANELISDTTASSSSIIEVRSALMSVATLLTVVVSVVARSTSCRLAARSSGRLATSSQPAQKSASCFWIPWSPGSLKSSSRRPSTPWVRWSDDSAPCSRWLRVSRNRSRVRVTSLIDTPIPDPSHREKKAGTIGPVSAAVSTRCREKPSVFAFEMLWPVTSRPRRWAYSAVSAVRSAPKSDI